jgi:hypothetical protein
MTQPPKKPLPIPASSARKMGTPADSDRKARRLLHIVDVALAVPAHDEIKQDRVAAAGGQPVRDLLPAQTRAVQILEREGGEVGPDLLQLPEIAVRRVGSV